MKLIIDVPEAYHASLIVQNQLYEDGKEKPLTSSEKLILAGEPLPLNHGRLIDLDAFLNLFQEFDLEIATNALDGYPIMHYRFEEDNWKYIEEFTPIVIEAEREE